MTQIASVLAMVLAFKYKLPPDFQQQIVTLGTAVIGGRMIHDGGRFLTVFQGDGNIVTYRRDPTTSAIGPPVWASGYVEP